MINRYNHYKTLIFIVLLNVFSSILHYVHNVIHFDHYPEPDWLSPQLVDAFWFVMTPIGIYGLIVAVKSQMTKGRWWLYLYALMGLLYLYALMGLLSLLHYNIETDNIMTVTMHSLIWFQAICAFWLIAYVTMYFKNKSGH